MKNLYNEKFFKVTSRIYKLCCSLIISALVVVICPFNNLNAQIKYENHHIAANLTLLTLDANNPINAGIIEFQRGDKEKAFDNFILSIGRPQIRAIGLNNLGSWYVVRENYYTALAYFTKAIKESEANVVNEFIYNSFLANICLNKYQDALNLKIEFLNKEIFPFKDFNLAYTYSMCGNYEMSIPLYETLISKNNCEIPSIVNLAIDLNKIGSFSDSNSMLESLNSDEKSTMNIDYLKGLNEAMMGNFSNAKQCFNNKGKLTVDNAIALAGTNLNLNESTDNKRIIRTLRNKLNDNKRVDGIMLYAYGNALFTDGKYLDAMFYYMKAATAFKNDSSKMSACYTGSGNARIAEGDTVKSLRDYDKAIEIDSTNLYPHVGKGIVYYKMGHFIEASKEFNIAMPLLKEINYGYQTLVMAGYSCYKSNEIENSINILLKAIKVDSSKADAYGIIGWIMYENWHFQEALKFIEEAIKRDRFNSQYYEIAGAIYQYNDYYEKSRTNYLKAMSLNPGSLYAVNGYAIANMTLGRYKRSLKIFNRLIIENPDSLYLYNNRCIVRDFLTKTIKEEGDTAKADSLTNLSILDNDVTMREYGQNWRIINRGNTYFVMDQDSLAVENYNHYPSKYSLNNIGVVMAINNKFNDAIYYFNEAIKADSLFYTPKYNLEKVLKHKNGTDNLIEYDFPKNSALKKARKNDEYIYIYLYDLPTELDAPEIDHYITEFISKPAEYIGPILDFRMVSSDSEIILAEKKNKKINIAAIELKVKIRWHALTNSLVAYKPVCKDL